MIKKRTSINTKFISGRKNSFESTTSSAESHNFRSTNDIDHKIHLIEKSPNKYKLITENRQGQNKNQLRKLHNLKLLGFIKVKENGQAELKNDVEQQQQFKKAFKLNQKGLIFDNHQYFLNLNAIVSNNHLIRQSSPVERLKVNLYDEERVPQISQYINTNSSNQQDTPLSSSNQNACQSNNNNKKKAAFRRRSCYCNQTGKQSQKAQKVDFQLPTTFIKNRIYQRMKKKQEMKMNLNDKDLIIQNLNRTFDIQEKNSARGSQLNSPSILNYQQNFNILDTPMSGKVFNTPMTSGRYNHNQNHVVHSNQIQRSQFSYLLTSPKNGQQTSNQGTSTHSKRDENTIKNVQSPQSRNPNSKPTFAETIQYIKEEQSQKLNQTPQSTSKDKKSSQTTQKNNSSSQSKELDLTLSKVHHRKHISSNVNSPKSNHVSGSPPHRQTPLSSSKKNSIFNYFSVGGKTLKDDQQIKQQYENIYPEQVEKRKKWITKLRLATKLVGFQEKQRKKSMLYQQDYYKALEEVANNEAEHEHQEQNNDLNQMNQEKKHILIRKVKQNNNDKNVFMLHQIVKQHNLKLNSTIGSFVDMRTKSYNSLLPSANSYEIAFSSKLSRRHLVSPFNYDSKSEHVINKKESKIAPYLQPFPVLSPSPNKQKSQTKLHNTFYSSTIQNTDQKNNKFNETKHRNGSSKKINSQTMTNFSKGSISKVNFCKNYLLQPKSVKSNFQIQLSNSQNSIDDINGNNTQNHLEASKTSLGQKSNNDKDSHQDSQQNIVSLDQLGRYESYFTKKPDQKNQNNNQTKAQQKFQLLINNQSIQSSYLINNHSKNNNSINNLTKSINFSTFNQKTSSQPNLLQSTFKNDLSHSSYHNLTLQTPTGGQNKRPSYLQQKFDTKTHRKSILQSYMIV